MSNHTIKHRVGYWRRDYKGPAWRDHYAKVDQACERILGLLADGPKTRSYLGGALRGNPRIIDAALRRLKKNGNAVPSEGKILNCRRGRTWQIIPAGL